MADQAIDALFSLLHKGLRDWVNRIWQSFARLVASRVRI